VKGKKIKAIIMEQARQVAQSGRQMNRGFDKDDIHKFRVAVKALRSFLRMLRAHTHNSRFTIPKKLKKIYLVAGAIRDAQLELEGLTGRSLALPGYTGRLQQQINRHKNDWNKCYSKKIFKKLKKRLRNIKYGSLPAHALEDFFTSKMDAIRVLSMPSSPADDDVHQVRKEAKDILYTSKMAKKNWPAANSRLSRAPLEQLDGIAGSIGDYRDQKLQLDHLSSFNSPAVGAAEEATIKNLCDENASVLLEEKIRITERLKALPGK
jgi:CHAD domain-containing protein